MTKKHFDLLAQALRRLDCSEEDLEDLIAVMVVMGRQLNARFNTIQFRNSVLGDNNV